MYMAVYKLATYIFDFQDHNYLLWDRTHTVYLGKYGGGGVIDKEITFYGNTTISLTNGCIGVVNQLSTKSNINISNYKNNFTIDYWINVHSSAGNATTSKSNICYGGGGVYTDWYNNIGTFNIISGSYYNANKWNHIAFIVYDNYVHIYVNGIFITKYKNNGSNLGIFWGGNDPWYGGGYAKIHLGQVAIRDYPLSITNFDPISMVRNYNRLYNRNDYIYGIEKDGDD